MTEKRAEYSVIEGSLTVPAPRIVTTSDAGRIAQLETELAEVREQLRRLRILWLWERGEIEWQDAMRRLGFMVDATARWPWRPLEDAMGDVSARARKALGLEAGGG